MRIATITLADAVSPRRAIRALVFAWIIGLLPTAAWCYHPPMRLAQYAHTAWTVRDGYPLGIVFSIAQTPDGYLWLGGSNGLFRFDGLHFVPWTPPTGVPLVPYSLLASRDGTLWIGTFHGLSSWNGTTLTRHQEIGEVFITSLHEGRDGTIWAGVLGEPGRLCAIRHGHAECYLNDGAFGKYVWSLAEDGSGALWAAADSGLWRWSPGPPRRFSAPGRLGDLARGADGELLVSIRGAGVGRLRGDKVEPIEVHLATGRKEASPTLDLKSNKLLADRDGGLWIGTDGHGLVHVQNGEVDTFSKYEGLSGDIACSLFEDAEGNIWFTSAKGLDRFRRLPFTDLSAQRGIANSVLATPDGSVWVASDEGLTQWKDGVPSLFGTRDGLPDSRAQSLYQDAKGELWVATNGGLAHGSAGRFSVVPQVAEKQIASMAGDGNGGLWIAGLDALVRLAGEKVVERIPWSAISPWRHAKALVEDKGGLWIAFWREAAGLTYFKDGKIRTVFTESEGLGRGDIAALSKASDGALWVATMKGGASRIQDGHVETLSVGNGLPCNAIHWVIEDDFGSLWLYTACGLVRVQHDDLAAWIADPRHQVHANVWGAADGVMTTAVSQVVFNPAVSKAPDGRLWFVSGDAAQGIDPKHVRFNGVPPPVHIEQLVADNTSYAVTDGVRLPPLVRDVTIEFAALSLVDPRNTPFRYRLDGHDTDWQKALDRRQVTYTNLPPGAYRFRVTAANNSGVWNEQGASLRFSIEPAIHQTAWFQLAAGVLTAGMVTAVVMARIRQLRRSQQRLQEVIDEIPAMAFSISTDGSRDLVNQRWLHYTGQSEGSGWESALHPDDADEHLAKWRAALASGEPFENEARHRNANGEYRWFLVQAVPLRDKQNKIVKWYGTLTDIEERKRVEAEAERLRRLEAHLAHTNRLSMLGELTASLAHEINQPISAVMVNAGAGLRWLEREEPELQQVREAIKRIKDDGKRAADIITGLKKFYRKDGAAPRALVDVNDVVREMLVLLQQEARQHAVSVRTDLAPGRLMVRADRVQMQQVLMNLMVNGMEAMADGGGELRVTTRLVEGQVAVSVKDEGVGIDADKLELIFDAFVSSKPTGTGMGLAISRSLVESHDGKLWAEKNPTRGATFHFTIPVA